MIEDPTPIVSVTKTQRGTVAVATSGGTMHRSVCLDCSWACNPTDDGFSAISLGSAHVEAFPTHAVFMFATATTLIHAPIKGPR